MRNKGAVLTVIILLTIVCLYYLSFTFVTSRVEKDAREYAQSRVTAFVGDSADEDRQEFVIDSLRNKYLDSMSGEVVYKFLAQRTYRDCKAKEINLGLDLKGGMNITLEISSEDIILALANQKNDPILLQAIQKAEQLQEEQNESFVSLFGEAFNEIAPGQNMAPLFITPQNKDQIDIGSSNEEVLDYLQKQTDDAIANAFEVLRKRIDHFGVVQPNIQKDVAVKGRFHIELPGVKDPERVRNLLQGTAKLEFWETYEASEVLPALDKANAMLADMLSASEKLQEDSLMSDSTEAVEPVETEDTDTAGQMADEFLSSDTIGGLEEQMGMDTSSEAEMLKQNPLFSILQPNVSREGQTSKGPVVGYAHYSDTAQINQYLRKDKIKNILPIDVRFNWTFKPLPDNEEVFQLIALKATRSGGPVLLGDVITNARAEFGQNQAAEVSMSMNGEGAREWAKITRNNVGKSVAIVLDGYVYSFPTVQGEIPGGRSSITGQFSVNEAKDLANVLKSGKMPAPARVLSEEIVGPTLGQKAISSGFNSFLIAFIVILLYMIFYYSRAGFVADIALIANVFFILGVLASFGAVLTLPGIAGIVLTIGMSVDANVLIYERIREELRAGKGLKLAIKDGYKNAYSAIIDANVTTLLTAIILFKFGVGPIQGFATTLIIGILSSLFSAIFITRLIFTAFLGKERKLSFDTRITRNAFQNLNIRFLDKRKIFYVVSGLIILVSASSLVVRGLNPGIDFVGGRNYVVKFQKDVQPQEIAADLETVFGEPPQVKTFGDQDQVKITTKYLIDQKDRETDAIVDSLLYMGLKPVIGEDVSKVTFMREYRQSSQKVGPSIAHDIKSKSIIAITLSLAIIFLYILIRFRKWQYGLGAIAALVHDTLFVLGLFSLLYSIMPFSMEIDQAFIAAILTVVGYSINDTVVVFDRIREYIGLHPKRDRKQVINNALNSTVSRTFSTSMSTFFVLLAIFVFGGEVIRGFTFALLVGVVVGTYSSLFIATPISYEMMKKSIQKQNAKKKKK